MTGDRWRVHLLFLLLGAVPVFLAGWLLWVQVLQAAQLERGPGRPPLRLGADTAARQGERQVQLPGARGSILDRHGTALALDCPTYDVEAEVQLSGKLLGDAADLRRGLDRLATELARCLSADPELDDANGFRRQQRQRLLDLLARDFRLEQQPASGPLDRSALPVRANVFLAQKVDALAVTQALRELDGCDPDLLLHWVPSHRRVYLERDATYGVVGWEEDVLPEGAVCRRRQGVFGLETAAALAPGTAGFRDFLRDSTDGTYWLGAAAEPGAPVELETTLDLELQKLAMQLLADQAESVGQGGKGTRPHWGALVLVEIATGDVLAMANWQRDVAFAKAMMATPYQCRSEPGSIVKPLLFAFALQHAGLDWNERIDCTPTLPDKGRKTQNGRVIHDDHACGVLTPHEVIVNSSNIGAVAVGTHLTRQQWREYLDFYRFAARPGLQLPYELPGSCGTDFQASDANFRYNSATALSIGYELGVTPLAMARAYLTLLSGAQRELRLYRGVRAPGMHVVLTPKPAGPRRLSEPVVAAVLAAMRDVVAPDAGGNHPTGSKVHKQFLERDGVDLHGLVGGKTGTAVSRGHDKARGSYEVRNASFVGVVPIEAPRYLAIGVLQKDDDARFYGGSYAAPAVVRLLLSALERETLLRLRQESQVSASPGGSGWNGQVPETGKQGGR